MDPLSGLKSEVFRPLAAVVLPGMLALTPFALVAGNHFPEVRHFFLTQPGWFLAMLAAAGTIVGMLLENLGSGIERGIDRCMEVEYLPGHEEVWDRYLSNGTTDNNGRRFLAGIVTRLKFINSILPALAIFWIGGFALQLQTNPVSWTAFSLFTGALAILLVWLLRTSTELSEVATYTRSKLIGADTPSDFDACNHAVGRHRHLAYVVGELLTSRVTEIDLKGQSAWRVIPLAGTLMCRGWLGQRQDGRDTTQQ